MSDRIGDWIQTFTGRCFWPQDPLPEEIDIVDIAHALSMTCRYAGHTKVFYSVAEHSILVSEAVEPQFALWGLLHDAAEAYTADLPKPLKRYIPQWNAIEARIMEVVVEKFGLYPATQPENVKWVDHAILTNEREELMNPCERPWQGLLAPLPDVRIRGMVPSTAYLAFMDRFKQLKRTSQLFAP